MVVLYWSWLRRVCRSSRPGGVGALGEVVDGEVGLAGARSGSSRRSRGGCGSVKPPGSAHPRVEVLEAGDHPRDAVADRGRSRGSNAAHGTGVTAGRAAPAARPADDRDLATQVRADAGSRRPREACTMPIESSTVTNCSPPAWTSRSVRPRVGRISASRAGDHVRAVELGRDLHGQPQRAHARPRWPSVSGVAADEVAAHGEEHARPCRRACARIASTVSSRARGAARSRTRRSSASRKAVGRLLPDAHGAVALHVGVAADRAEPGAGLADVAAQQQQVDDLLDGRRPRACAGSGPSPSRRWSVRTRGPSRRPSRSRCAASARSPRARRPSRAARTRSAYSSNPCVCSRDELASTTVPGASSASSSSSLESPGTAPWSPPSRICRKSSASVGAAADDAAGASAGS